MVKKLIIVSGNSIKHTPVILNLIKCLKEEYIIDYTEYKHKHIFNFLFLSVKAIFCNKNKIGIVFIGSQSLPLLFLSQFYNTPKYYWAFESYKFKLIDSPLVQKTLIFEKLIFWNKINLIVPSKYRAQFFKKHYKHIFIVENVPKQGNSFYKRNLEKGQKILFILYGRLCDEDIYLTEFIKIIGKYSEQAELHIVGWEFNLQEKLEKYTNIFYHGSLSHEKLIEFTNRMHYSIIGYRPNNYNLKYCAPNKLYEAFSRSLPVIANKLNPPLVEIIKSTKAGVLLDFDNLEEEFDKNFNDLMNKFDLYNSNSYKGYSEQYYLENYLNPIFFSVKHK